MDLHVERWGELGPPAILVHGSVTNGEMTWSEQRPLAQQWSLLVVDRRGYWPNPPGDGEDFEADAGDVVELLEEHGPVHLMGHSYGAVVSLLAAGRRPDLVRSLVVVEPPAFGLARDDSAAREKAEGLKRLWATGPADPEEFLRVFLEVAGSSLELPAPLPPPLAQAAVQLRGQRLPMDAPIPVDDLRRAGFPKLVVDGGHDPAFTAVCDVLAEGIGASRLTIRGAGHSVPRTGGQFNEAVERLWDEAERKAA